MIKIGELKRGDLIVSPAEGIGEVCGIEYSRTVDDEWEKVNVLLIGEGKYVNFYTPTSEIRKLPFKVGDRVECIDRYIFDDRIQVGDKGFIENIDSAGNAFVKFDRLYRLQKAPHPEEYLRKIEEKGEKGEKEMKNIKITTLNWYNVGVVSEKSAVKFK